MLPSHLHGVVLRHWDNVAILLHIQLKQHKQELHDLVSFDSLRFQFMYLKLVSQFFIRPSFPSYALIQSSFSHYPYIIEPICLETKSFTYDFKYVIFFYEFSYSP
jgi:hypothetical protein